jgi:hypothetical protein
MRHGLCCFSETRPHPVLVDMDTGNPTGAFTTSDNPKDVFVAVFQDPPARQVFPASSATRLARSFECVLGDRTRLRVIRA